MSRKIRFGVVGLGVGMQHIPGFLAHPSAELAAVCDLSEEKLTEARKQYPGVKATTDASVVIRDPSIDVVSIASYDKFHKSQIIEAFDNGKHVFAEKPLCLSEDELEAIRAAWSRNGKPRITSNLILRRYPRFLELRDRIQEGRLGKLYNLEADYNYGRLEKIHQGWRGDDNYSVTLGGGIHMVDLMQWLAGEKIMEVSAFANRICSEGSKYQGNDMVTSIVKFSSGVVGKMNANFGCVFPHFHRLALYGTRGTYLNDLDGAKYVSSRDPSSAIEVSNQPYPGARKGDLLYSFVESILENKEPEISSADVFSGVAVCLAIEKSVRENRLVKVLH